MTKTLFASLAGFSLLLLTAYPSSAQPYGPNGFQGRIALSHDGNFNDEDDWGAFPVVIAMLDAFGVKDKLVHIDYNNIIQDNDDAVREGDDRQRPGGGREIRHPPAILHNCRTDLDGAIKSITRRGQCLVPRESPLLLAGRPDGRALSRHPRRRSRQAAVRLLHFAQFLERRLRETPNRRPQQAGCDRARHQVDSSRPGDLLAYSGVPGDEVHARAVGLVSMDAGLPRRAAADGCTRGWRREERCDVSDATITYFLLTGDEQCDPKKLAALLDKKQKPEPIAIRPTIRLEAENFTRAGELRARRRSASRSRRT